MNAKIEVEQPMGNWKHAVINQNIEQIMACYAEDVRAFDAIAELQFTNRSKYQGHWQRCLQLCKMTKFEIGQVDIKVDGNLAVRKLIGCITTVLVLALKVRYCRSPFKLKASSLLL